MSGENDKQEIVPGFVNVEDFFQDGFKILAGAIRQSNFLGQNASWQQLLQPTGDELLSYMNEILWSQGVQGNIKHHDVSGQTELIIEANDRILERVSSTLRELDSRKNVNDNTTPFSIQIQSVKAELPVINGAWNRSVNDAKLTVETLQNVTTNKIASNAEIRLLTAQNIVRPQITFKTKVDNTIAPWQPRLKEKPHSRRPLAIFLEKTEEGCDVFCHPYETELLAFEPDEKWLTKTTPIEPRSMNETPLHLISTEEELMKLVQHLRLQTEIAVDVEHHAFRSYLGISCLMQISTLKEDYLVDVLKLRDEVNVLNEIFADPKILKVFHGAKNDILWLQRDFSLYVVNMFDTHLASKRLEYTFGSLAHLLQLHCNITADKRFQLADWRMRPLPEELQTYARQDTHYLLYISQIMRNQLLEKGKNHLMAVFNESTQLCLQRYEKPIMDDKSHLDFYKRSRKYFDNRQMFALKKLFLWRDTVARENDESIQYVLPNHMLLQIAENLPREMQGILACCNQTPPLVKMNLLELHRIILLAREQTITKAILGEDVRSPGNLPPLLLGTKPDDEPHDSCQMEVINNLPTLLGDLNKVHRDQDDQLCFETMQNYLTKKLIKIEVISDEESELQTKISEYNDSVNLKLNKSRIKNKKNKSAKVKNCDSTSESTKLMKSNQSSTIAEDNSRKDSTSDEITFYYRLTVPEVKSQTPQITIFDEEEPIRSSKELLKLKNSIVFSPYERYRRMKEFVKAEDEKIKLNEEKKGEEVVPLEIVEPKIEKMEMNSEKTDCIKEQFLSLAVQHTEPKDGGKRKRHDDPATPSGPSKKKRKNKNGKQYNNQQHQPHNQQSNYQHKQFPTNQQQNTRLTFNYDNINYNQFSGGATKTQGSKFSSKKDGHGKAKNFRNRRSDNDFNFNNRGRGKSRPSW